MFSRLSTIFRTQIANRRYNSTKVAVIGAPIHKGQPKEGVQNGPQVVRQTNFVETLQNQGVELFDSGDIQPSWQTENDTGPSGEKNFNAVMNYNKILAEKIASLKQSHDICLTIGGDHSIGIGTVAGHSQGTPDKQILLLWVDAHADINSGKSSGSKNMHGMSVSFLLKEMDALNNKLGEDRWPRPCLNLAQLTYIGLRDIDSGEQKILRDLGVKYFTTKDIDKYGIQEVIARSFDHLNPQPNNSLHVSFDIDSLDPLHAPSTGTPVHGGLTLREGMQIVEAARDTGVLGGFDLVEVNPSLGSQADLKITKNSAFSILTAGLSGHRGT